MIHRPRYSIYEFDDAMVIQYFFNIDFKHLNDSHVNINSYLVRTRGTQKEKIS
jgi:hypothetical protein